MEFRTEVINGMDANGKPVTMENATLIHEGREFTAGGAFISDDYLVAYTCDNATLQTFDGKAIGTWHATSSWPAIFFGHRSWIGSRMYQIVACVNGVKYCGRGFGTGMLFKGKRSKTLNRSVGV